MKQNQCEIQDGRITVVMRVTPAFTTMKGNA
jgi:hypothetical protein